MSHNLQAHSSISDTPGARPASAAPARLIEEYYQALKLAARIQDSSVYAAGPLARAASETAAKRRELADMCREIQAVIAEVTGGAFPETELEGPDESCAPSFNIRETVQGCVTRIASEILAHRSCLNAPARSPTGEISAEALALRQMAEHAMLRGMRAAPHQQNEFFLSGIDTLRRYLQSPGTQEDAQAWFDMGWMLWRSGGGPAEAENAIRLAAELSTDDPAGLYLLCLMHLMHLYCERGCAEDAQAAAHIAVEISPSFAVLYDAARCAALAGQEQEALNLLERAIEVVPLTYVCMLADSGFSQIAPALKTLSQQLLESAQEAARQRLEGWKEALERTAEAEVSCQCEIKLPAQLTPNTDLLLAEIGDADLLSCLEIAGHAALGRTKVYGLACEALEEEAAKRSESLRRVVQRISETRRQAEEARASARAQMTRAVEEAARERDMRPRFSLTWSIGLALVSTVIGGNITGSVESGLAIFLPAMVAFVSLTYLLNFSSASLAYMGRADVCRREHALAVAEIEQALQRSLKSLEQSAAHLRDLKLKVANEIAALKAAEAATPESTQPETAGGDASDAHRQAA